MGNGFKNSWLRSALQLLAIAFPIYAQEARVPYPPSREVYADFHEEKLQEEVFNKELKQQLDLRPVDHSKLTREELFELAFKKKLPPKSRDYMVRLFVDDIDFGEIQILHNEDFSVFDFYSSGFSHYLDSLLSKEGRKKTNGLDGHFNSKRMDSLHFALSLDDMNYELRVYVPPELKTLRLTNLKGGELRRGQLVKPAAFSFYTNMQGTQRFYCTEYLKKKGTDIPEWTKDLSGCERNPLVLDLNGAFATMGWVLEGAGVVNEPQKGENFSKNNMRRNNFTLIHDMYSYHSRLSLGDIDIAGNVGNLLHSETMGGVRYEYNERFFANNPADELYKISFTLTRPAQVEVQLDGKTMHRISLPAGKHQINGFGGHAGSNVIQVFITQEDGSFMAIPYEFELGSSRNLHKGESRYSVSAGTRRSYNQTGYDYDIKVPGFNGSYLYGLNPFFSLGANGQASSDNFMMGPQFLLSFDSLSWGELRTLANYTNLEFGFGAELEYYRTMDKIALLLRGYYQSEHHNPHLFEKVFLPSSEFLGFLGRADFRLPRGSFSANAGVSLNRKEKGDDYPLVNYRYGASLSQNVYGFSFRTGAEALINRGELEPFIYFGVNYSIGAGNHNFAFSDEFARRPVYVPAVYEVESSYNNINETMSFNVKETPGYIKYEWKNSSSLNWNWSSGGYGNGLHSYSASLDMYDNFSSRLNAQHSYNRMQLYANYSISDFDIDYSTMRYHFVYAMGGMSFMFADGLWAFGRPVDNGFILADVRNGLKGSTVHINHSEYFKNDYSESGLFGAAYYNQILNYRPNEIQVSLTDVSFGSWLEQDRYYAMGGYKQGYAVRLGSAANVLMQTRLLTGGGEPMPYTYVAIAELDAEGKETNKHATFTNRAGFLQMGNLRNGHKYRIIFGRDSYIKDIDFDIPANSGNLIILPDIRVEHE
jgi:outer membrane usher protein FimD/PapC